MSATKTIFGLGLIGLLMNTTPSFAKMGAETGGGGDAVMVNGVAVIRDIVAQNPLTQVRDNLTFIREINGFNKLITEIAKVDPQFATDIIRDLASVRFYISSAELDLLPHAQTSLPGTTPADVQLAIRTGSDILLAPQFFENKFADYTLIHEALHGLLKNASGPAHHQRVRNIVNYLYNNRGNLDSFKLNNMLAENDYIRGYHRANAKFVWNKKLIPEARCFFAQTDIMQEVAEYSNLECSSEHPVDNRDEIAQIFPGLFQVRDFYYYTRLNRVTFVGDLELKKDTIFNSRLKDYQISRCYSNNFDIKELNETISTLNEYKIAFSNLEKDFLNKDISLEGQEAILKAYTLNQGLNFSQTKEKRQLMEDESIKYLKIAKENQAKCQKQYKL